MSTIPSVTRHRPCSASWTNFIRVCYRPKCPLPSFSTSRLRKIYRKSSKFCRLECCPCLEKPVFTNWNVSGWKCLEGNWHSTRNLWRWGRKTTPWRWRASYLTITRNRCQSSMMISGFPKMAHLTGSWAAMRLLSFHQASTSSSTSFTTFTRGSATLT